jgi:hypothetical protein
MAGLSINSAQFNRELLDLFKDVPGSIKNEVHKDYVNIMTRLFAKVVVRSPFKTGRFKGSWNASVGSPSRVVRPRGPGPHPEPSTAMARKTFMNSTLEDKLYITNALPYASRLANGYSRKAPSGWIEIAMDEAIRGE